MIKLVSATELVFQLEGLIIVIKVHAGEKLIFFARISRKDFFEKAAK